MLPARWAEEWFWHVPGVGLILPGCCAASAWQCELPCGRAPGTARYFLGWTHAFKSEPRCRVCSHGGRVFPPQLPCHGSVVQPLAPKVEGAEEKKQAVCPPICQHHLALKCCGHQEPFEGNKRSGWIAGLGKPPCPTGQQGPSFPRGSQALLAAGASPILGLAAGWLSVQQCCVLGSAASNPLTASGLGFLPGMQNEAPQPCPRGHPCGSVSIRGTRHRNAPDR